MIRAAVTVLALFAALPASAQQLSLDIRDGLVTLQATNVPVRQVLAEWARVGGTRVVGGDRVTGAPLTLSLEGVPEAKALDIVLRGAAGYVAAARSVPGSGRSAYDRIMVLATSTPPAAGASPAASAGGRAMPRAFGAPPAVEPPDTADYDVGEPEPAAEMPPVNPFANAFGQPGTTNTFGQPPNNPFAQPMPQNPFGQPMQPQGGQGLFVPVQPQAQPPSQPAFGVIGSPTPGVIQQPPGQPGVRPPPQG